MTNFDRSIEFSIRPYVSVGPVAFEMNRIEVHEVLGNPDRTHRQDASVVCLDVWEDHGLTIAFKNPTRLSQFLNSIFSNNCSCVVQTSNK